MRAGDVVEAVGPRIRLPGGSSGSRIGRAPPCRRSADPGSRSKPRQDVAPLQAARPSSNHKRASRGHNVPRRGKAVTASGRAEAIAIVEGTHGEQHVIVDTIDLGAHAEVDARGHRRAARRYRCAASFPCDVVCFLLPSPRRIVDFRSGRRRHRRTDPRRCGRFAPLSQSPARAAFVPFVAEAHEAGEPAEARCRTCRDRR